MRKGQAGIILVGILLLLAVAGGVYLLTKTPEPKAIIVNGTTTPESNVKCRYQNNMNADPICTPGKVLAVTTAEICTPGYSASVNNLSEATKKEVYANYGITTKEKSEYQIDHLIPLELGGSNELSNLWPEPITPIPGYNEKNKAENKLRQLVCDNKIPIQSAQYMISHDWQSNSGLYS